MKEPNYLKLAENVWSAARLHAISDTAMQSETHIARIAFELKTAAESEAAKLLVQLVLDERDKLKQQLRDKRVAIAEAHKALETVREARDDATEKLSILRKKLLAQKVTH